MIKMDEQEKLAKAWDEFMEVAFYSGKGVFGYYVIT